MMLGPWATQFLGDMGADVIKIERPGAGEWERGLRAMGGLVDGQSPFFLAMNRNKALDLGDTVSQAVITVPAGQASTAIADVSLPPTLGLDLAKLSKACAPAQFQAGSCAKTAQIGTAVAQQSLRSVLAFCNSPRRRKRSGGSGRAGATPSRRASAPAPRCSAS